MSTTIIAVIINTLSMVLPYLGISVASTDLTNAVQVIIAIATGVWIWYQRATNLKAVPAGQSDVSAAGLRK